MKNVKKLIASLNLILVEAYDSKSLAEELHENWGSDAETFKTISSRPMKSIEMTQKVVQNAMIAFENEEYYRYIIMYHDMPIGFITLSPKKIKLNKDIIDANEIGLSIGSKFWGKGIGSDSVQAIMDSHKEENLYFATIKDNNPASVRVFEKLGFKLDSYRKRKDVYINDNLLLPEDNCYLYIK